VSVRRKEAIDVTLVTARDPRSPSSILAPKGQANSSGGMREVGSLLRGSRIARACDNKAVIERSECAMTGDSDGLAEERRSALSLVKKSCSEDRKIGRSEEDTRILRTWTGGDTDGEPMLLNFPHT
jgi:hypothetical protein